MQLTEYSHNDAVEKIDSQILDEARSILSDMVTEGSLSPSQIKDKFYENGWPGNYQIDTTSNITITSIKENVGLCVQFGNIARGFYDFAKLDALFQRGTIDAGIFVCPALDVRANTVHIKRMSSELANIFNETFTVPLLIVGIE